MTTGTTYHYRLPLPPRGVGSNAGGGHWGRTSKPTREYRAACAQAFRDQGVPDAPLERVVVELEMRVCGKRPRVKHHMTVAELRDLAAFEAHYRPTDAGNVHAACKALLDAMQPERSTARAHYPGAGIVPDDSAKHVALGMPRLVEVPTFEDEGVWVEVRVM